MYNFLNIQFYKVNNIELIHKIHKKLYNRMIICEDSFKAADLKPFFAAINNGREDRDDDWIVRRQKLFSILNHLLKKSSIDKNMSNIF